MKHNIDSATKLKEDILTYAREHQSFNSVKLLTDPKLINETSDGNTVTGAYYFNINGKYGFLCDNLKNLDQHAADLLCQSMEKSKATNWFNQGYL